MRNKSHVSMEQHQCFACGALYDTGAILLDKRLKQSLGRHTVTGTGMCPEHQALIDDARVLLLGSNDAKGESRTGDILVVRTAAFKRLFNIPVPKKKVAFVDPEVVEKLKAMMQQAGV